MMYYRFTPEQSAFIIDNAPGKSNDELTALFNAHFGLEMPVSKIKSFKHNRHISSGLTGHFPKGNVPFNKGKKGLIGANRTSFKKGDRPKNYRPVGSERITKDGYIEVKVTDPNKWRLKHVVIWEEANGPLPKGHCVIFLDSNKLNISLDNLQLISRKQLARLNQNHLIQNDAELTKAGIIIADIYSKIGERRNATRNRRGPNTNPLHRYSQEQKDFILANYKGKSTQELTDLINAKFGLSLRTGQIRSFKLSRKLKAKG